MSSGGHCQSVVFVIWKPGMTITNFEPIQTAQCHYLLRQTTSMTKNISAASVLLFKKLKHPVEVIKPEGSISVLAQQIKNALTSHWD